MTTLLDVARRAGVSRSTVSNVVRGSELVSEATRKKVERAIAEFGYQPNVIARALRARSTTALGIVLPDLTNPFHAEMTVAAEKEASRLGFALLAINTECDRAIEQEAARVLIARQVDGVVVGGMSLGSKLPRLLLDRGIAVVFASLGDPEEREIGMVDTDDASAMEAVVSHLCELGHRDMAFVSQRLREHAGERRRHAFVKALVRRGLRPLPSAHGATAVIAHNDMQAIAMIDRLESQGLRIPDDVSIVGFDDIPLARHSRIGLTTIRSDATVIGRRAVELVLEAVRGKRLKPFREILPASLVIRSSTGKVKA
jgi:DNA-binding LacI/PurR family transcriptional regulator